MTQNESLSSTRLEVLYLRALGCDIRLSFSGSRAQEAIDAVRRSWSWCAAEPPADRLNTLPLDIVLDDDLRLVENTTTRIAASDLRFVMHVLSQAITVACIDHLAGSLLMLHAGAIADPATGRALAFVAGSGTGKTTFTTTHGPGRIYVSDETVAIKEDRTLTTYPKPLSVRSGDALKDQIDPEHFALLPPDRPVRLEALWMLDRTPGPVEVSVTPVSTLDALVMLAPQISYLAALPAPLQHLAEVIEAVGGLKRVTYHEASDLRAHVIQALEGSA